MPFHQVNTLPICEVNALSPYSLSVIMPAYNEEKTILAVLGSLLKQIPEVYEIIVIDDGSKDETVRLVEEFITTQPRVRLMSHPANRGRSQSPQDWFSRFNWRYRYRAGCRPRISPGGHP